MVDESFKGLRIAIYARFSSEAQREASIEDQVHRCREYIEERGGVVREDLIFSDRAVSGTSMDRRAFQRLSELATGTPPEIDAIVAEDLSRVGRDQADLHHFRRSLEFSRVRLIALADGIDTAKAHSELAFTMKTAVASLYMRDLRDKTLRGLEGRARAGFATGGVAFGYKLLQEHTPDGKRVGSRIEIDGAHAKTIRRIFDLYLGGHSHAAIAKRLNAEGVNPPRVHAANRRRGWKDTTVRAILHNVSYVGQWRYKAREWRKVPGTNKRRPRSRDESEVMTQRRPHLRIVDDEVWNAVQSRLRAVRTCYTRTADGKPKGRAVPSRATPYLFSSLLHCARCGSKMVVSGGSSTAYYRCEGHSKRGICKNALSVKENVARASLLDELRHRLLSGDGIAHARKRIAERLGELARTRGSELREHHARLAKMERQIARLIEFVAEGEGSPSVREKLRTLERDAAAERRSITSLERATATPIKLPTPDEMLGVVFDLERRLLADVTRGREELRLLFRGGRIDLVPQPGGFYVARSEILPLVLLTRPPPEGLPGGRYVESRYSPIGCAGRI